MLHGSAMSHADAFRWISVAVSIILGLGLARLLTAAVAQFHARRRRSFDWIPLTWAFIIFCQQISFWWSLDELSTIVARWSMGHFLMLVGLALALFLAAALILPHSESHQIHSLRDFFEDDGRWALPVLAGFNALALVADRLLWGAPLASVAVGLNLAAVLLPLIAFAAGRRVQAGATVAYVAVALFGIADLSPASY